MQETPKYYASEMVRIELLRYPNPIGLHPIEQEWRDLARKLLGHVEQLQVMISAAKPKVPHYNREELGLEEWKPFKFPSKFSDDLDTPNEEGPL